MTGVDFKKLKAESHTAKLKPLFAIIIGPSGAGKSSVCGTIGVSTLVLHNSVEHHGPLAARTAGRGEVVGLDYTVFNAKSDIDVEKTLANLLAILRDENVQKEFGAVVLDSATELQKIVAQTDEFRKYCLTDKGTHNSFKEGEAYIFLLKKYMIDPFVKLNNAGLHVITTCAADVKSLSEDGAVSECSPKLLGFSVAHDLIRAFSDVLLVSRVVDVDDETGESKSTHRLLFKANISKQSKDIKGQVLKTANFSPRISGFTLNELPDTAPADLSKIIIGREKQAKKA